MNNLRVCMLGVAVLGLLIIGSPTQAAIISGTNANLTQTHGLIYIPQQPATSGPLGLLLGAGPNDKIGYHSDTMTLTGAGTMANGDVSFTVKFKLSSTIDPSSKIMITAKDLDCLPQLLGGGKLKESLAVTFLNNATDIPGPVGLTIKKDNYGFFRPDGFGPTNDTTVVYSVPLSRLGVTPAMISRVVNGDHGFALFFTMHSTLTQVQAGSGQYINTPETFNVQLNAIPSNTPEPASMLALLAGVPMLLRRRNRK